MRGLEQTREMVEGDLAQAETRERNKKERPRLLCQRQWSRPLTHLCTLLPQLTFATHSFKAPFLVTR